MLVDYTAKAIHKEQLKRRMNARKFEMVFDDLPDVYRMTAELSFNRTVVFIGVPYWGYAWYEVAVYQKYVNFFGQEVFNRVEHTVFDDDYESAMLQFRSYVSK